MQISLKRFLTVVVLAFFAFFLIATKDSAAADAGHYNQQQLFKGIAVAVFAAIVLCSKILKKWLD